MKLLYALAAGLVEWQGRAVRLFTQTIDLERDCVVCVMCLTAEATALMSSPFQVY